MSDMVREKLKCYLPRLWLSKMQVVNAVEVHVLCMPGKCSLPHAKVEVGSVDTLDYDATLLLHHIQQGVEVTDIPLWNTLEQFY